VYGGWVGQTLGVLGRTSGTECLGPGEYAFEVHICTLKTNKPELMAVFLHILECHTNVDILCNALIKIYT
jgi:hypothetical protein